MSSLRLLNDGSWSKDPALFAARRIVFGGLAKRYGTVSLGSAAEFLNGTSYERGYVHSGGAIPIIRISNISDPGSAYLRTDEPLPERFRVHSGDLLVSWSASFKSIIWPGPEGWLNQHIFKVTERPGYERSFIRHAIEASFDSMQESVVGIGMMHLRRDAFLSHQVPSPPADIQAAVAAYLDEVEVGSEDVPEVVRRTLGKEVQVMEQVRNIARKVEEARRLSGEVGEEAEALCRSILVHASSTQHVPMRSLLKLRPTDVAVRPDEAYQFAGVYSFGRGVFRSIRKRGSEFSYLRLTTLREGDFVYPKLMAWEGALGVVPRDCNGCVVSPEFPVFEVDRSSVLPEVLDVYFRTPSIWPDIAALSTGTNVRRRRVHPSAFLGYVFPLPDMATQQRMVGARHSLNRASSVGESRSTELEALLPAVLDKAFRGEM